METKQFFSSFESSFFFSHFLAKTSNVVLELSISLTSISIFFFFFT